MRQKLIGIDKVRKAIADWKAPYEVAAIIGVPDEVKSVEEFLKFMVDMGWAKYGAQNNTYRLIGGGDHG